MFRLRALKSSTATEETPERNLPATPGFSFVGNMPVPKRYFHCSQELNHDAEMWEFTTTFGDRALRTWLQILVFLDRSENQWRVSGDWLGTLSRMVRQSSANCSRQVAWLVEKQWLQVLETTADGSPLVFRASNWSKYNRTREHKGSGKTPNTGTQRERKDTPSFPTPTPTPTPSEDIKKGTGAPSALPANDRNYHDEAKTVLGFLNEKTGKKFREVDANLNFIMARLKSGVDLQTCKTLIARKVRDWNTDPKMQSYLRPETLFNKTKFETYLAEVNRDV